MHPPKFKWDWLRWTVLLGVSTVIGYALLRLRKSRAIDRMKLFDDIERNDDGPRPYAMPEFIYLNGSARSGVEEIRQTTEGWFSKYPRPHRAELRARFRSDNYAHRSAYFELFLHELLLRLGCTVEIHPEIPGTGRHPDFLVTSKDGSSYYLEAILATDETRDEMASEARKNRVYDVLNKLESSDFYIGMDLHGAPATPPPGKRIRAFLAKHLEQLDRAKIAALFERGGFPALPHWRYEHDGWTVDFFPIPKSGNARMKPGVRPLGVIFEGVRILETRHSIRKAIQEKAGRYGRLPLPYVIGVNVLSDHVDDTDAIEALFGDEQLIYRSGVALPQEPEYGRAPNGAFYGPRGAQNTRVSSVLVFEQLNQSNIPWAAVCLYHNPWASRPYDGELNRLRRGVVSPKAKMEYFDGETLAQVFGLRGDWPGE